MFDFDLSKLTVIAVVALIVLGPERLPRVARTAGTLLGRAQRYLGTVRDEVDRQMQADALRQAKHEIKAAVGSLSKGLESAVGVEASALRSNLNTIANEVQEGLPGAYLPSIHEHGGGQAAALFQPRLVQDGATIATIAKRDLRAIDAGSSQFGAVQAPRYRTKWRGATAGGVRRKEVKRHRLTSGAADKRLGRGYGRLAS